MEIFKGIYGHFQNDDSIVQDIYCLDRDRRIIKLSRNFVLQEPHHSLSNYRQHCPATVSLSLYDTIIQQQEIWILVF